MLKLAAHQVLELLAQLLGERTRLAGADRPAVAFHHRDYFRGRTGQETLIVLAVANGVTFMTQPADSGFWMVKELGNLSVRDVMVPFNVCKILMSLTGLAMLLAVEAW